jgi:hypothetical protein
MKKHFETAEKIIPFPRPWPFVVEVRDSGPPISFRQKVTVGCTHIAAMQ